jgi:hypothetical protein
MSETRSDRTLPGKDGINHVDVFLNVPNVNCKTLLKYIMKHIQFDRLTFDATPSRIKYVNRKCHINILSTSEHCP